MTTRPTTDAIQLAALSGDRSLLSASRLARPQHTFQDEADTRLSINQQNLLLAALQAQAADHRTSRSRNDNPDRPKPKDDFTMNDTNSDALFMSPLNANLDNYNDFSPDLDYLDGDNSFDFEDADLGGQMLGALPGSARPASDEQKNTHSEQHDKRKSPDEDEDDVEEGDAKRQETLDSERGAKKPGRKPLTNEPTTKRKAQNRAAQRAFRERKEKHLKDLEVKVDELTKLKEVDQREKGVLKAEVQRLQAELKEHRKHLSLSNNSVSRSPPLAAAGQNSRSANFSFDFSKFGILPGNRMLDDQTPATKQSSISPSASAGRAMSSVSQQSSRQDRERSNSHDPSPLTTPGLTASPAQMNNFMPVVGYSTNDNMHGFADALPQMSNDDVLGDLFSPSILKTGSMDSNNLFPTTQAIIQSNMNGGESTAGLNRAFQFNSGSSAYDSASPSTSSSSRWNANGANSSCGTSPEPSHDSPSNKEKPMDLFSEKNGGVQNWSQHASAASASNTNMPDFTVPSTTTFDPLLFDNYRDSNDGFLNPNDFSGGFFDEALQSTAYDFGSPSNLFGILQSPRQTNMQLPNIPPPPPSRNLMAEVEKTRDDDYTSSTAAPKTEQTLINCNNIWNQLQSNPDFQDGKFDLDNLCSELRAKARCSESGVVVQQQHVEAALRKLSSKEAPKSQTPANLMHQPESWENVLKKMKGSS